MKLESKQVEPKLTHKL